jgi:hypothetical protein
MKKIPAIIIFILLPLIGGYFATSTQGHKTPLPTNLEFKTSAILPTDRITLAEKGAIISLSANGETSISTNHPALIETLSLGANFIGIDKQTNYSTLDEFSSTGSLLKTLQDGNTGNIDTMNWFTDPAINASQTKIAFVSDKNKATTNVLDNALFVENLVSGTVADIADPDPHSGGIADPVWDPADPNLLAYDYYQYDDNYNPYSIIDEYNLHTQTTNSLTTQKDNAYQGSFSADGKQFVFLERNNDITTVMYVADVTENGLSNVQRIASGDFAYPKFSNTPNHIYYLQTQGNTGYDLYTAILAAGKLTNPIAISTGEQLLANSGFTVNNK